MADSKKYDGSQWEHSLRELGTATETIQSGDTIYANGQPITAYTLKGNEEHTGTPSPQNPVMPNGVGERSANLVSMSEPQGDGYLANSVVGITGDGRENIISAQAFFVTEYIPVSEGTYYYYSDLYRATANNAKFMFYNANKEFIGYANRQPALEEQPVYELSSFSAPANAAYMRMNIDKSSTKNCLYTSQLPSYEPYGAYKIPISTAQGTSNIYLSEPLYKIGDNADTINSDGTVTRRIGKWVFNGTESWYNASTFNPPFFYIMGLTPVAIANSSKYSTNLTVAITATGDLVRVYDYDYFNQDLDTFKAYLVNQYANGTPETIYYILATPTTEQITLPSIPTTEGANSISVDTTVQPSEFTATWTGWHDSSVKEYDGTDWQ